jgi:hypothetical protein
VAGVPSGPSLTLTQETKENVVRFEVFTAVTMKNGVFWVVTPYGSCKNRRPKRRFLQEPHGVTTQKTPFFKENVAFTYDLADFIAFNLINRFISYSLISIVK